MTKDQYAISKFKKQLLEKKERGVKELIWKLSAEQNDYVNRHYRVEPYLYEITTRTFFNIRSLKSTLLKEIHYKSKKGKRTYVRKLNKSERKELDDYGIKYKVAKHMIYLNQIS